MTKPFLLEERHGARAEAAVDDCAAAPCTACGACDYDVVTTRVYREEDYVKAPAPPLRPLASLIRTHLRIRYSKLGKAAALSHLETMSVLLRAMRRTQLPLAFSQGFHPKPKVGFGPALPVGLESTAEYLDLELVGEAEAEAVQRALAAQMPGGFEIGEVERLARNAPGLVESIAEQHFRVRFPEGFDLAPLRAGLARFAGVEPMGVTRDRGLERAHGKRKAQRERTTALDVKSLVTALAEEPSGQLRLSIRVGGGQATVRPSEVLAARLGPDGPLPVGIRLMKERVSFAPAESGSAPSVAGLDFAASGTSAASMATEAQKGNEAG